MTTPGTITAIIATYNDAAGLEKTLRSIREQAVQPTEVIVIDGGSTDSTRALLASSGDVVTVWRSEPDGGIYHALNKGLRLASGDWILVLGAGDTLAVPDAIEILQGAAARCTRGMVYFNVNCCQGDQTLYVFALGPVGELRRRYGQAPPFHHQGVILRRSWIERIGLFDTSYSIHADYLLMGRIFAEGGADFIPAALTNFQLGGASTPSMRRLLTKLRELRRINRQFDNRRSFWRRKYLQLSLTGMAHGILGPTATARMKARIYRWFLQPDRR